MNLGAGFGAFGHGQQNYMPQGSNANSFGVTVNAAPPVYVMPQSQPPPPVSILNISVYRT